MKKNSLKKLVAVVVIAAMILSFCSCAGSGKNKKELIIGTSMSIEQANRNDYNFEMLASGTADLPIIGKDSQTGQYYDIICSCTSADSKNWNIKVIDGMKWSDSSAVTAKDIHQAMINEAKFEDLVEEYHEDGLNLNVVLKESNVRFPSELCALRPFPSDVQDTSIWCGPYCLESFDKDSQTISFVKNEYWPEKNQKYERITFKLFGSEDTMYMALLAGDIDAVWNYSQGVSSSYIDVLYDSENITLLEKKGDALPVVLCFNQRNAKFSDKNLRLAISYALDYPVFTNYLTIKRDGQTPNRGVVSSSTLGYKDTDSLVKDISEFERYMGLAGYSKKDGKYYDASGNAFSFVLSINSSKEKQVAAAELIKYQLENLGISVLVESLDSTAYNAKTSNKFSNNNINFEAALMSFTEAGMNMGAGLGSIYVDATHSVQGACGADDSNFHLILSEMSSAATIDEYRKYAKQLQDYYEDECPMIALIWDYSVYAVRNDIDLSKLDANLGTNNVMNFTN